MSGNSCLEELDGVRLTRDSKILRAFPRKRAIPETEDPVYDLNKRVDYSQGNAGRTSEPNATQAFGELHSIQSS
jgi:hypothetical protein